MVHPRTSVRALRRTPDVHPPADQANLAESKDESQPGDGEVGGAGENQALRGIPVVPQERDDGVPRPELAAVSRL